jgi:hypothetical protein
MKNNKKLIKPFVKFFSFLFIGLIFIFLFLILLNLCIGVATHYGILLPKVEPLITSQRFYYHNGSRNIWQYQDGCVELDNIMIYKPSIGVCNFDNLEFNTSMTFSKDGRKNTYSFNSEMPAIAVLGDSHAMGWGVNDDETFSAQLQKLTNRRVFNLAVSSYATERELDSLSNLDQLQNIDTVIIQYCDNDINSNFHYPIDRNLAMDRYTKSINQYKLIKKKAFINNFFKGFKPLKRGFKALIPESLKGSINKILGKNLFRKPNDYNELRHRESIENVLIRYSKLLQDKRVFIFFISAHNQFKNPSNWNGLFEDEGLNVNFIDLDIRDDLFYTIDDHLNVSGHYFIAKQLNDLLQ